mmetsp:Transcript_38489/g.53441  ORF Transcript_38489/g.53441 Transcript_38489/m.53441 type:complete len:206 (+) Transcript_38489:376-993(+)
MRSQALPNCTPVGPVHRCSQRSQSLGVLGVHVCFVLQEKLHGGQVTVRAGQVQRSPLVIIHNFRVQRELAQLDSKTIGIAPDREGANAIMQLAFIPILLEKCQLGQCNRVSGLHSFVNLHYHSSAFFQDRVVRLHFGDGSVIGVLGDSTLGKLGHDIVSAALAILRELCNQLPVGVLREEQHATVRLRYRCQRGNNVANDRNLAE